jgi:hypothetical protein
VCTPLTFFYLETDIGKAQNPQQFVGTNAMKESVIFLQITEYI